MSVWLGPVRELASANYKKITRKATSFQKSCIFAARLEQQI